MNSKILYLRCEQVIRRVAHHVITAAEVRKNIPAHDKVYKSINAAKRASRSAPFGTLRVVDRFPAASYDEHPLQSASHPAELSEVRDV